MTLTKVTQNFRAWLRDRSAHPAAAALILALVSPALALQPSGGDAAEVVIVPQQSADTAEAQLVPPAPDAEFVAIQAQDPLVPPPADDADAVAFGIEINPAPSASAAVNGRTYDDVYRSIPYNYTEYLANPGYRHDATMEILFGVLRPTTIVRQYEPKVVENPLPSPYQPYRYSHSERWQYRAPDFRLLDPGCCQ